MGRLREYDIALLVVIIAVQVTLLIVLLTRSFTALVTFSSFVATKEVSLFNLIFSLLLHPNMAQREAFSSNLGWIGILRCPRLIVSVWSDSRREKNP